MTKRIEIVDLEDFEAYLDDVSLTTTVRLVGSADQAVKPQLDVFLTEVHRYALDTGVKEIVLDFRDLEFMNSSCFKSVVMWFARLREVEVESRYKIRLLSSPHHHWQRRSLHALLAFSDGQLTIE